MATFACVHSSLAIPFITPPSTSNCMQQQNNDSDCGSSSGLGGMKTQEASDECASSSSSHAAPASYSSPLPMQPTNNNPMYSQPPPVVPLMAHPAPSLPPQHHTPSYPMMPLHQPLPISPPGPPPPLGVPMNGIPPLFPHYPPPNIHHPPPPPGTMIGPMSGGMVPFPWVGGMPHGPNNILFVHVQPGETVSLLNNGDQKMINGPATINMFGDVAQAHVPLPITVPAGHQCHQFVDELGILRHIVLSLEPPSSRTEYPREMNVPQIIGPATVTEGHVTPFHQPMPAQPIMVPPYHANRKWFPRMVDDVYYPDVVEQDQEENDRIKDMVNRIVMPQVARVMTTEVDIIWQPIDTSEASAAGGPFPQIDASEFTYHASIYESSGRFVASYVLDQSFSDNNPYRTFSADPNVCNKVRVGNLRPNTDYSVQVKAALEERSIYGEPSPHLFFRTAPGRPEAPLMPKLVNRGHDFVHLQWRQANNNGAAVNLYYVYVGRVGEEEHDFILQFGATEARIPNLQPGVFYKFRITSVNALGESFESAILEIMTKPNGPPPTPLPPTISNVTPRSVRLTWQTVPGCAFSIEVHDVAKKINNIVRERLTGASVQIGDLTSNSDYKFRIFSKNSDGESPRSEWVPVRTHTFRNNHHNNQKENQNQHQNHYQNKHQPQHQVVHQSLNQLPQLPLQQNHMFYQHPSNNFSQPPPPLMPNLELAPRTPSNPVFVRYTNRKPEIGWKSFGQSAKDLIYNLEASTFKEPNKYKTVYKGNHTTFVVTDDDIQYVRVQAINKRGLMSDFTDRATIQRLEADRAIQKPERISRPNLTLLERNKIRVSWAQCSTRLRPKCVLSYMVQRTDSKNGQQPVYTGPETETVLENLPSQTLISVRVRAAIMSNDFNLNGDWSETASIETPRSLPFPPKNARYSVESNQLCWDCDDESDDLRFKVEIIDSAGRIFSVAEVKEQQLPLETLIRGENYQCRITSVHDEGECEETMSLDVRIPPKVPSRPEDVSVSSEKIDSFSIQWTSPEDNGSPISSYRLKLLRGNIVIRDTNVIPSEESQIEFTISELEPHTSYRVEISAENAVGLGPSVTVNGTTKPLPPIAPKLECEPEANAMRIRWRNGNAQTSIVYKLVRVNKNEQLVTIYEGENLTAKVKNLTQDTAFTFQIRATNKLTGASVWSEPVSFRTCLAPPPTVRQGPTATISTTSIGHHHVEWSHVLPNSASKKQFYRLQVAESRDPSARWHTVYEGVKPSFLLKSSQYNGPIHLRVFCVRVESEGETKSQASPVTYVINEPVEIDESNKPSSSDSSESMIPIQKWIRKSTVPLMAIVLFAFLAFLLANFCDWLFSLTQNNESIPTTTFHRSSSYTPVPPSMPSKMAHNAPAH